MRISLITLLLLSSLQAQNWPVTTQLDSLVAISLPATPEVKDTAGSAFVLLNMDSSVVLLSRLPVASPIPNARALSEYYDGLSQGFLAEVKGKPIDMYDTLIAGLKTRYLHFRYTYPKPAQPFGPNFNPKADTATQTDFRRCWFWIIDTQVYALQYWYMGPSLPHHVRFADTLIRQVDFTRTFTQKNQLQSPPEEQSSKRNLSWIFFAAAFVFLLLGYMLVRKIRG